MAQDITRRRLIKAATGSAATLLPLGQARSAGTRAVDLAPLRKNFAGVLLTSESPNYERERRTFWYNPRTDKHPAVIAKCVNEDDVVRCLEFADTQGLRVAVRSGGHDALGASTCEGGLVIDTRPMATCRLSSSGQHVAIGGGAKTGEITDILQQSGLAVPFGDSSDVGVAGLALGGGYGWLSGKYGATCDHLRSARLVLADGRRVMASAQENPDLFWAIRGGGGNFGIATELEFDTREVGTVLSGKVVFAGDDVPAFLRFYRDYMAAAPDELAVELNVSPVDRILIVAQVCWSGDPAAGARVLSPLLSYGPPLAVGVTVRPYTQIAAASPAVDAMLIGHPKGPPGPPSAHVLGGSIAGISDPVIHEIEAQIGQAPGRWGVAITHHLHGAVCRPGAHDTALVRRAGSFSYHLDGLWGAPEEAPRQMAWVDQFQAAMRPLAIPSYVNYLASDDPGDVARTYGANFPRLRAIKRRYDPTNRFSGNRNIPPA